MDEFPRAPELLHRPRGQVRGRRVELRQQAPQGVKVHLPGHPAHHLIPQPGAQGGVLGDARAQLLHGLRALGALGAQDALVPGGKALVGRLGPQPRHRVGGVLQGAQLLVHGAEPLGGLPGAPPDAAKATPDLVPLRLGLLQGPPQGVDAAPSIKERPQAAGVPRQGAGAVAAGGA